MKTKFFFLSILTFLCSETAWNQCGWMAEIQPVDVQCAGEQTGSAAIRLSGAPLPVVYQLSGVLSEMGTMNDTAFVFDNLFDGQYFLQLTDANNCEQSLSFEIAEPEPLVGLGHIFNEGCGGDCEYTIEVTASGGIAPYRYIWSTGDTTAVLNNVCMSNLPSLQIIDANGCAHTNLSYMISEPSILSVLGIEEGVSCLGEMDGTISLTAFGGTPPYAYLWDYQNATTAMLDSLATGIYTVTVTDADGCTTFASFLVDEPSPITIDIFSIGGGACDTSNCENTIDIFVSGGTKPYAYLWSTGDTTEDLTDLCASDLMNLSVQIIDANGCQFDFGPLTIAFPNVLQATATVTDELCHGSSDGRIDVNVSGGNPPYFFTWDYYDYHSEDLYNIPAGTYSLTITDNDACQFIDTFTVEGPEPIAINYSLINSPDCSNDCAYELELQVSGGTMEYGYSWSNGATTSHIQELCPVDLKNLSVTITDSNGCTATKDFNLLVPNLFDASADIIEVSCDSCMDGSIDLSVVGGVPPYTYNWSTGAITQDISNLPVGLYTVTITDSDACTITLTLEVESGLSTKLTNLTSNWSVAILPNPATDKFVLQVQLLHARQLTIRLFDVRGSLVQTVAERRLLVNGVHHFSIDREGLAAGIYFVQLLDEKGDFSIKKVVFN